MPTASQPERQPRQPAAKVIELSPKEAATPGVWRLDRPGRPRPYGCQWREKVWSPERRKTVVRTFTEFFTSAKEREDRMAKVVKERTTGKRDNTATPADLREWRAFMAAADGVSWQTIFGGYRAHLASTGRAPCTVTVSDWGKTYLANCERLMNSGELSPDNVRHKRSLVKRFVDSFGHFMLDQPTEHAVEKWIDGLGFKSNASYNSARKHIMAFFNSAVGKNRPLRDNPIADLRLRRFVSNNRKKILSPQEMAQLFHFAMTNDSFKKVIGLGALEAFAGIRFSSAYRFDAKNDLHPAEHTFVLPAPELKTGKESGESHMVDTTGLVGMEPLWKWIAIAPADAWEMTPRQYLQLKSAWFKAADVRHPPNTLRHSFATYDLHAHRNPGRTAYVLGHANQKLLWKTYKGNATKQASELYQQIEPSTCLRISQVAPLPELGPPHSTPAPTDGS